MIAQAETRVADNGVNVAALLGARKALEAAPEAAQFKWRARCEWIEGVHSRSTVEGFYGLGAEQQRKKSFTFDADHPEAFAATDKSATPVEILLVGAGELPDRTALPRSHRIGASSCVPSRRPSKATWICTDSRHRPRRPQRLQRRSASISTSTPTQPPRRSKPSSRNRSGVRPSSTSHHSTQPTFT